ncbi:MAG: hypothetical protein LBQ93_10030 [Treponema sp.]|nr:hypothetical protein [Treponema sp.]
MMKKICLFLIITLCIGCQRREDILNANNSKSQSESSINTGMAGLPVLTEADTVQEKPKGLSSVVEGLSSAVREKIENYSLIAPELSQSYNNRLAAQIEGNFTGSGNREIVVFYDETIMRFSPSFLNAAFCLVLDSSGENIENIYHIDWFGVTEGNADLTGVEELGREIIWKDKIIGRISDFNGNGREELFLSLLILDGTTVIIFEFDGTEFVELLNERLKDNAIFTGANLNEKTIDIQIKYSVADVTDPKTFFYNTTYQWDNTTGRYEKLTENVVMKRVRRNPDTGKWEFIED